MNYNQVTGLRVLFDFKDSKNSVIKILLYIFVEIPMTLIPENKKQ